MPSEAELTERLRCPAEILSAVELWFFRDLGETQRRQLFNWCGFPGVEANGEELQRKLLSTIIAALCTTKEAWLPMSNIAWLDGRDVVLLAHDMEIHARYCPGEWSEDTPVSPREYSGAVWSAFDDALQFEIEECADDPAHWHHHPVTHWREPMPKPGGDYTESQP